MVWYTLLIMYEVPLFSSDLEDLRSEIGEYCFPLVMMNSSEVESAWDDGQTQLQPQLAMPSLNDKFVYLFPIHDMTVVMLQNQHVQMFSNCFLHVLNFVPLRWRTWRSMLAAMHTIIPDQNEQVFQWIGVSMIFSFAVPNLIMRNPQFWGSVCWFRSPHIQ